MLTLGMAARLTGMGKATLTRTIKAGRGRRDELRQSLAQRQEQAERATLALPYARGDGRPWR
jgi:hypothetical protein